MDERDLMSLLPARLRNDRGAFDVPNMRRWDHTVCIYLLTQGYETCSFVTVDYDSCGPLVRGVHARKFGERDWHLYTYG